jgi:aerobic-type carbon monoxide dehydrogenase small subunit (CoxS/CutS family)
MVVDIHFRTLRPNQQGAYMKYALRRAQAISVLNLAVVITWENKRILQASITLGAVAPTIIHAPAAESYLEGRKLDESSIRQAAQLTAAAARPIDDLRSSARYREQMVQVLTQRTLTSLAQGSESMALPGEPVLLWGGSSNRSSVLPGRITHNHRQAINTRINGKSYTLASGQDKSLLRLLREDVGLTGTKEGCAEGECGACTIFLDGSAVMSCLVPAPRAHGAEITTIEGLAQDNHLHPVQQSFIDFGAVQCGYCTPGFVMSAVKLLEEKPAPTQEQIRQAITGNLCRCTGYYKIVEAIENASRR